MVYLIHFDHPYHHCRHYIGYTNGNETLEQRFNRHKAGDGAKLLRAVSQAGIGFKVVRVWDGEGRDFERRLKLQKNAWRLCPVCNPKIVNQIGSKEGMLHGTDGHIPQETKTKQACCR